MKELPKETKKIYNLKDEDFYEFCKKEKISPYKTESKEKFIKSLDKKGN